MALTKLTTNQLLYIVIASIILLAILFVIVFVLARRSYKKHSFEMHYYHKLRQIVEENDYYLINKFTFKIAPNKFATIDHVIGAEKYIYLICDYYFTGDLSGSISDQSLIHISKNGKKQYCDNPLGKVDALLKKYVQAMSLDNSLVIGVAIVNDECKVNLTGTSQNYFIVQRKRVASLIKALESRNIGNINEKQFEYLIKTMDKMNKRKR